MALYSVSQQYVCDVHINLGKTFLIEVMKVSGPSLLCRDSESVQLLLLGSICMRSPTVILLDRMEQIPCTAMSGGASWYREVIES